MVSGGLGVSELVVKHDNAVKSRRLVCLLLPPEGLRSPDRRAEQINVYGAVLLQLQLAGHNTGHCEDVKPDC